MTKPYKKQLGTKRNNQHGYTLISLSISLIIIGLFLAAGANLYSEYQLEKKTTTTQTRVQNAIAQIEIFRNVHGRYPCPSSLTAARNSPTYGTENENDCKNIGPAIPAGSCVGGVCVINSDPTRVAISPTVRIGALPFRALQLDEREIYDSYGSRLLYAVTEKLAVESTFKETEGGINIIDENDADLISPKGGANFVVLSHGPNMIGSFSIEGTQTSPCPAIGTSLESNNCVNMASPPASAAFRSSLVSLAGGATDFDDTIDYFSTIFDPTWKRATSNPDNIEALITNNLGAGVSSPTETVEISQNINQTGGNGVGATWDGGLRVSKNATNSSLQANVFCQQDGTQCFDVEDITGATGIGCTNIGEYMIGIEGTGTNAVAKCAPVKVQCDPGKVLVSIDGSGNPVCSTAFTNCAAGTIQICSSAGVFSPKNSNQVQSNSTAIGADVHNTIVQLTDTTSASFATNKKKAHFKCDNGIWKYYNTAPHLHSGFCGSECVPPAWAGPPPYTGTTTTSGTTACAGAMSHVSTATTTTCSFVVASCTTSCGTVKDPCGCAAYFPVVMGVPTTGPSTIPPPAQPAASVVACPAGYNTGNKTTPYIWDSSDAVCNWKPGPTSNTCACNPALAGAAPAAPGKACNLIISGTTGTAPAIQAFDSTAGQCKWKVTGYDSSVCSCDTTTEYISGAAHAPTCNTACDNETVHAVWAYKYILSGGVCIKDADYIKTPATCSAKPFNWDAFTLLTSSPSQPGGIDECGTSCRTSPVSGPVTPPSPVAGGSACPELNTNGSCWKAEGNYNTYKAKCQSH